VAIIHRIAGYIGLTPTGAYPVFFIVVAQYNAMVSQHFGHQEYACRTKGCVEAKISSIHVFLFVPTLKGGQFLCNNILDNIPMYIGQSVPSAQMFVHQFFMI
jgi:hypothetical protein